MNYQSRKKEINKQNFIFQSDNLIALAKMVVLGLATLKQNGCEELLDIVKSAILKENSSSQSNRGIK